jgi:hypothetical protein
MSTTTNGHRSVFRSHLDRLRAVLLLMGFLLLALPRARPAYIGPLVNQGCRTRATVNGPLLVLYARGGPGHLGPTVGDGRILVVHGSKVVRTLTHGLPFPFTGGLVSSPCGRYVAYGEDAMPGPGRPPQTQGLWLTTSDGRVTRRLLLPPPSATGQPDYSIGPIAWSPDRRTLAYAVNNAQDYGVNPRGLGVWLTRYDRPHPRLAATLTQLGVIADGSQPITQLSWSPDGHILAVSAARSTPRPTQPGQITPVVVAFDLATGKTRVLVSGGWYGVFSPVGKALAYVTGGVGTPGAMVLWVADARGRHGRRLASVLGTLFSPAWSPDGRTIAYIEGGVTASGPTAIHTVDVASGRNRVLLAATAPSQPLVPPGGRFIRLAWIDARA